MKKFLLLVGCIGYFYSCGNKTNTTTTATISKKDTILEVKLSKSQIEALHISFAQAQKKNLSKTIESFGELIILPNHQATVNSKVRGIIEKIFIHEGQNISKGESLFSISSSDIIDWQDQYLKAKSQLIYLSKEYERQKLLSEQNISSTKNLEMAKSEYYQAESQLKIALAKLQNAGVNINENDTNFTVQKTVIIKAPISGNISEVLVNIGSAATESIPLCRIISTNQIHAHIQIHPIDATLVKKNMKIALYINGDTNPIYSTIEYISQEINTTTKTISLHIDIPPTKQTLISGMPVKGMIYVTQNNTYVLSSTALAHDGQHYFMFYVDRIIQDTLFIIRSLSIANELVSDKEFAIPNNFNINHQVVVSGVNFIDGEMHKDEMQE